jgi:FemAB-related protein (PEP-CTERM system-associated)
VASLSVREASTADARSWDHFVAETDGATGYHEWAWRTFFERGFGHEPIYLMAHRRGDVAGVLPRVHIRSRLFGPSLTSLPFLNYGGVLSNDEEAAGSLIDAAAGVARARGCPHVELRHIARRFESLPCRQHKVTMQLPLAPGLWERLDRKVRNQIRKAQKSGLSAETGGAGLLDEFYAVFARNMRDLGTPVYGRRVFAEALRAFPDRTRLHVVRLGRLPVAAGLTYRTGGSTEIPWASSVRDHNALCPNHLLYWHILESAVQDGGTLFDFGRSTPNEGTYKFKEQWGARPVTLHWEYVLLAGGDVPNTGPANPKYRLAIDMWRKLPLAVANRLGPHIVRSIP